MDQEKIQRRASDNSDPDLEQIKKHTKRTGALLSKSLFVCSFMRSPPSTLCAQGGFQPLECDVFGHLQRLQFYTGRLMTPFVIIILMVLVIIMFVFRFSFKKTKTQPPSPLGFLKPRCGSSGCFEVSGGPGALAPHPRAVEHQALWHS